MIRAFTGTVLATALLLASPVLAGEATAATCTAGAEKTTVKGTSSLVLTHVKGYKIKAGSKKTVTTRPELVRRLTANATGVGEGTPSAKKILAKVNSKYSTRVVSPGDKTPKKAETSLVTFDRSSKTRQYSFYAGTKYWTGTWKTTRCAADGNSNPVVHSGTWTSFGPGVDGGALCPASRYKKGSYGYKACKAIGA